MGYIKLFRSISEWTWIDDPNTLSLWIHLLLNANWKDGEWHGESVARGTMITSISRLSQLSGLTEKRVRTCLDRLVKGGEITKEGTTKWTRITVCKYDLYQCCEGDEEEEIQEQSESPEQPETKQESTVEKEIRKIKEGQLLECVDRLYKAYPSKCPVSGRSTGKGSKDKRKLESLLRNGRKESELNLIISNYIQDCIKHQSFIKNFQTFLNNIPDISETPNAGTPVPTPQESAPLATPQTYTIEEIRSWYPKTPNESDDDFNARIDYICKVKERDGITIIYEK